jgi:DNA topoisomerase-1
MKRFYRKKSQQTSTKSYTHNDNSKYLVIVESPSKCHKIEDYLGSEYKCISSKGHIREIDGLKSICTKDKYQITFSEMDSKKSHIEWMRQIIDHYDHGNIYLATDDDREGEAISWHICEVFGLPISTTKRILFHEITKIAILEAIQNPTTINMQMVYAQHSRQVLDIIVGYKVSPMLWKHIHNNKTNGLSAGRCQTPALRLIYENEKKNLGETSLKHKIKGYFFSTNSAFQLHHTKSKGKDPHTHIVGECVEYQNEEEVKAFMQQAKNHKYMLTIGESKLVHKPPPKPFTTSLLLQTSSNLYHYSPKTTMDLCQQLYQMGLITYMRTDSSKYSQYFLKNASDFILKEYGGNEYLGELKKLQNNDISKPHEAIRVTNINMQYINDENKLLVNMYRLIWKNSVESCMSDCKIDVTPIHITAPNNLLFLNNNEITRFLGWKRAHIQNNTEEINESRGQLMYYQSIQTSQTPFSYNTIESNVTMHNNHHHYTESSLIQKLEDLGIGRPSTYSSIVHTIQERGYVIKKNIEGQKMKVNEWTLNGQDLSKVTTEKVFGNENNKLVIQPIGIITMEFLLQHFQSLFDYDYTKKMEEDLDILSESKIEDAQQKWYLICKDCMDEIKQLIKPLAKKSKQSYPIDNDYQLVFHQYGASLKKIDEDGNVIYKAIKKNVQIDLEKLKNGMYTSSELLEIENDCLGNYEDEPITLKSGKYGPYIQHNGQNISLKGLTKDMNKITLDDVIPFIIHKHLSSNTSDLESSNNEKSSNPLPPLPPAPPSANLLRELTPELSIRKGKFGAYIYYKTPNMPSPAFYNLKKFKQGFKTCTKESLLTWIKDTYNIPP